MQVVCSLSCTRVRNESEDCVGTLDRKEAGEIAWRGGCEIVWTTVHSPVHQEKKKHRVKGRVKVRQTEWISSLPHHHLRKAKRPAKPQEETSKTPRTSPPTWLLLQFPREPALAGGYHQRKKRKPRQEKEATWETLQVQAKNQNKTMQKNPPKTPIRPRPWVL